MKIKGILKIIILILVFGGLIYLGKGRSKNFGQKTQKQIQGMVIDSISRKGIDGVAVSIFPVIESPDKLSPELPDLNTVTNKEGRFGFKGFDAGDYRLFCVHKDYIAARVEVDGYVPSKGRKLTDIALEPIAVGSLEITGIVQASTIREGIQVFLASDKAKIYRDAKLNKQGEFSFTNLPPGDYQVWLMPSMLLPYRLKERKISIKLSQKEKIAKVRFVAEEEEIIKGRVLNETSKPISGAEVVFITQENDLFVSLTDDDGWFTLMIPAGQTGRLKIEKENYWPAEWVRKNSGEQPKSELVLRGGGAFVLEGLAKNLKGKNLESVSVLLESEDSAISLISTTNGEGRFAFKAPAGKYRIIASTEWGVAEKQIKLKSENPLVELVLADSENQQKEQLDKEWQKTENQIEQDIKDIPSLETVLKVGDISKRISRVKEAGGILGKVRSGAGKSIQGVTVVLTDSEDRFIAASLTVTDKNGRFAIVLPTGKYKVHAGHIDFKDFVDKEISLTTMRKYVEIDFTLESKQ